MARSATSGWDGCHVGLPAHPSPPRVLSFPRTPSWAFCRKGPRSRQGCFLTQRASLAKPAATLKS